MKTFPRYISYFFALLITLQLNPVLAEEGKWLKPYVLASEQAGKLSDAINAVKSKVNGSSFKIVGEYSPYKNAHVIGISSDALQSAAAASKFGGYGAVVRVGITQVGDKVQVAYVNPKWMSGMYRMKNDLSNVAAALKNTLGAKSKFGTAELWAKDDLNEYHYTVFMPYFDDQLELAEYGSHADAVKAVEAGLAASKGGTSKVYRVDVQGKDEVLFGVAIKQDDGSDATVMGTTDVGDFKHTPHLPYEMLVSGNQVYALHGKFRIAQSFPDLTMTTFMKISGAPDAIENSLKQAAGK